MCISGVRRFFDNAIEIAPVAEHTQILVGKDSLPRNRQRKPTVACFADRYKDFPKDLWGASSESGSHDPGNIYSRPRINGPYAIIAGCVCPFLVPACARYAAVTVTAAVTVASAFRPGLESRHALPTLSSNACRSITRMTRTGDVLFLHHGPYRGPTTLSRQSSVTLVSSLGHLNISM